MNSFDFWMIFSVLFLCFVAFIANLTIQGNKDAIAAQYQSLLDKYNAIELYFTTYETGIDGMPQNTAVCIFYDNDAMGFQLWNSEFDNIVRLNFNQIRWLAAIKPNEYIDINLELPPTEYNRVVVCYNPQFSSKLKYIVFNSVPVEQWCLKIDAYAESISNDGYNPITHIAQRTHFAPQRLIHSRNELDAETNSKVIKL